VTVGGVGGGEGGRGEGSRAEGEGTPLQKWLQAMGVGTKVEVRELIRDGLVSVDGVVTTRYAEPVGSGADVRVEGVRVEAAPEPAVWLMNKPPKHLTTLHPQASPEGGAAGERPGLWQYFPEGTPRLFPVGRLDLNTEGALLWTNDGVLARRILHPDWELPKVYAVKVRGHLEDDAPGIARMRAGMSVGDATYLPVDVRLGERRARATWLELTLREGKNRQIRKMCWACGYQIVKLRRDRIGPIELGALNKRCVRPLERGEVEALRRAVGLAEGRAEN
jgi:23S rRNA pseudouridine2605 synthase